MTAGGQATPTGLAAVWAGLEALEKRQNDLAATVGRDVQMQADRIEALEERVLKLENPLHMPLVKLEEQIAGLRRATEGHFGMVHERIEKLEERVAKIDDIGWLAQLNARVRWLEDNPRDIDLAVLHERIGKLEVRQEQKAESLEIRLEKLGDYAAQRRADIENAITRGSTGAIGR